MIWIHKKTSLIYHFSTANYLFLMIKMQATYLPPTVDKAVKAIHPFLKELSEVDWWTGLLAAWINFEAEGPPKSVSSFDILLIWYVPNFYIIATAN